MVTMMGGEKDDEVLSMSLEDMVCPLNYAVQEIGMSNLNCILP